MRIKLGRMVGNGPLDSTALMGSIIFGAFDNGEFMPVSTVWVRVSSSGAGDVRSGARKVTHVWKNSSCILEWMVGSKCNFVCHCNR